MEYKTKKNKNDIELNIILSIAILAVIIFVIAMIITIVNVHNNEKNANDKNKVISNIKNDNTVESNNTSNETATENQNDNTNTTTDITNDNQQENTNDSVFINSNINTNNSKGKYSNNETVPFRMNGAKILSGDLSSGLTIQDSNGNEWVWIEVPKSITQNANTDDEIEKALEEYTKQDSTSNDLLSSRNDCKDANYNGTGMTNEQYITTKSKMLQSIKKNGGFYIGKYEIGYELQPGGKIREGSQTNIEYQINEKPVIKSNVYPYNWVNLSQAEKLSQSLATDSRTTSLLFGIQWDLIIKYLNTKGMKTYYLTQDSTKWGNYSNNGNKQLLKTGNQNYTAPMGIYDLAGNVWEWTLERASMSSMPSVVRGGDYSSNGSATPVSYRGSVRLNLCSGSVGFRCALY